MVTYGGGESRERAFFERILLSTLLAGVDRRSFGRGFGSRDDAVQSRVGGGHRNTEQYTDTQPRYAGEDAPRTVIPTSYGYLAASESKEPQYFIGDAAGPNVYRPGQTIHAPVREGVVEDWPAVERILEGALKWVRLAIVLCSAD